METMQHHNGPVSRFRLELALDRRPLTVERTVPLGEVMRMMAKAQSSCSLPGMELSLSTVLKSQARARSVYVVEGQRLLGVFTEREAIKAIALEKAVSTVSVTESMAKPATSLRLSDSHDVFGALNLLRSHQVTQLPVLDAHENLVGAITPEGIRSMLHVDPLLKASTLEDIMYAPVPKAPAAASVSNVAQLMAVHDSDFVVLTTEFLQPGLAGIVLARDVIQLWMLGLDLSHISAQSISVKPIVSIPASESALSAYWSMQQQQVQQFVVTTPDEEIAGLGTPISFLYTMDISRLRQTHEQIQQSVQSFSTEEGNNAHGPAARMRAPVSQLSQPEAEHVSDPSTLREQLECSRLLSAMALHVRESLQLEQILQTSVDEVREFLKTERVMIYRFNPDMSGTVVVESVASGWQPALNSTIKDTCFGKNYAQAYRDGRFQVVDDIYAAELTQCHIDILVLFDVRASLVVPVLQDDHLWGLLCAYQCSGPRHWRSHEINLLQQLATHMAIAIQQSELYHQLQHKLTEQQRIEGELKRSLKEKEALLKEIHHRVKNNLQIVSSVLRLQSDYIQDKRVTALFNDSQNRIRSMALIHEKLYQSRDLLRINMEEYVQDLIESLLSSYGTISRDISVFVDADTVWLNIDTAIPCGLIVNELVANALKHAFPATFLSEKRVWIRLSSIGENRFTLAVSDNGIGFPAHLDFQNTETLGLELVCVFTEQLKGTIELVNGEETTFRVAFTQIDDSEKDR